MIKKYPKEDIEIVWEQSKCIHAAECVKGNSKVFDPRRKPWIETEHASKNEIKKIIANCPSGALSIKEVG